MAVIHYKSDDEIELIRESGKYLEKLMLKLQKSSNLVLKRLN